MLALLLDAARRDGPTCDEPLFIAGGLASWQQAHHLFPEGGALPQRLIGASATLLHVELPRASSDWRLADGYAVGLQLLRNHDGRARELLFASRLPIVLCCVAFALGIFLLVRRLLGPGAGLLALGLCATCPLVLAHGHLATADLLAAATLPAAAWCAHRCLLHLTWKSLALSCVVASAAFLAKMSVILVPPAVALVVALRMAAGAPTLVGAARARVEARSARMLGVLAAIALTHALAMTGAAWAAHDFRWKAPPADASSEMKGGGWEHVGDAGPTAALVGVAREHRLVPEAWLYGLQYTIKYAEARRAYAEGRYSLTGWWWFFPRAFVLKMPLALLVLLVLGLAAFASAWQRGENLLPSADAKPVAAWARAPAARDLLELAPLLAFGVVYSAAAITSNLNLGVRHLLPLIPTVLVVAAAAWRNAGARARGAVAVLAVVAAAEGMSAHPHHVAWMNVAGGPAASRWTHLVDSSLDWGQGITFASDAVDALAGPGEPVHLSYFGSVDPSAFGLRARGMAGYSDLWRVADGEHPVAGLVVVSATNLVQLTSRTCPGRWRPLYETFWRESLAETEPWRSASPEHREAMIGGPEGHLWRARLARHDDLVAGRLCAFMRNREPLAVVAGGAMLVHRFSAGDMNEALFGPPAELATGEPVPFPIVPYLPTTLVPSGG